MVSLTREMLNYLVVASPEHKAQLCDKITAAAQRWVFTAFGPLCDAAVHESWLTVLSAILFSACQRPAAQTLPTVRVDPGR